MKNCQCGKPVDKGRASQCSGCYTRQWRKERTTQPEPGFTKPVADKHRYPFAPLERLVPAPEERRNGATGKDEQSHWERVLGVSNETVTKYRQRGMSWDTADALACRIGLHPGLIWDDWFERGFMDGRMDEQEESAA